LHKVISSSHATLPERREAAADDAYSILIDEKYFIETYHNLL